MGLLRTVLATCSAKGGGRTHTFPALCQLSHVITDVWDTFAAASVDKDGPSIPKRSPVNTLDGITCVGSGFDAFTLELYRPSPFNATLFRLQSQFLRVIQHHAGRSRLEEGDGWLVGFLGVPCL